MAVLGLFPTTISGTYKLENGNWEYIKHEVESIPNIHDGVSNAYETK